VTLTHLLEIEQKWVSWEVQRSLQEAERLWRERGSPTEPGPLEELLERVLTACQREGIPYAAVLLKRKRQLGRGEWKPRPASGVASAADPFAGIREGDPNCPRCQGSGYIINRETLTCSMCTCNRLRRSHT
jgi:hypothetical protein